MAHGNSLPICPFPGLTMYTCVHVFSNWFQKFFSFLGKIVHGWFNQWHAKSMLLGSIWAPPPPPRRVQKFQGKIASLQYFPCRWFRWPFLHHSSHTLQQYHLNSYILQWSLYSHHQCAHGNNKMPANLSVTNRSHSLLMTVEEGSSQITRAHNHKLFFWGSGVWLVQSAELLQGS